MHRACYLFLLGYMCIHSSLRAQVNTDRVMLMGRNALYYEDYVLAIQRFNSVIQAKPWLGEPYFYRGVAKFYLEDFLGATKDCTEAIERNPYWFDYYNLRALCYVNLDSFALAEADYKKALLYKPLEQPSWYNMVLCQLEQKKYDTADSTLNHMIKQWPKKSSQYTLKAQVAFLQKDTLRGESYVNQALECDSFDASAWTQKAMLCMQRQHYSQAESALTKAIVQKPRQHSLYINRALARYNMDNFRGAMSDYDTALEIQPGSFLAHYNRGLLRAFVGADNLAIEDFDYVLKIEPENTIARYNRALLLDNTGDYIGAIRDIDEVIRVYPQFWTGYQRRASLKRKMGDVKGAEKDEFKVLQAQLQVKTGSYKKQKTRPRNESSIEDYEKLLVEENSISEPEFESVYRGKIQNQKSTLHELPYYTIGYYKQESDLIASVAYSSLLESVNAQNILPMKLCFSLDDVSLSTQQMQRHLHQIDSLTQDIESSPTSPQNLLVRALAYFYVRDFEGALADLNTLLHHSPDHAAALWLRGQVRLYSLTDADDSKPSEERLHRLMALQDFSRCATLSPDTPYTWYNCGTIQISQTEYLAAVESFTQALRIEPLFAEAYFNRGVAHIKMGETQKGLADLSRAGELGLYQAYSLIKQYSTAPKHSEK